MLYVAPDDRQNMYKMYKALKDITHDKGVKVKTGDVVLSYIHHDNSVYFQIGEKTILFFLIRQWWTRRIR